MMSPHIVQAVVLVLCVIITFVFNAILQYWLLHRQGREKIIDALLQLVEEQKQFYAAYWEKDAADGAVSASINETMQQTRFDALLEFAGRKYKFRNINDINRQYRKFCKTATGDNFGEKNRAANTEKARHIHAIANQIYIILLENKV